MNKKLHSSYPVLKSEDSSYKQEINFLGQTEKDFLNYQRVGYKAQVKTLITTDLFPNLFPAGKQILLIQSPSCKKNKADPFSHLCPSDPTNTSFLGLVLVGRMFTSLTTESMVTI